MGSWFCGFVVILLKGEDLGWWEGRDLGVVEYGYGYGGFKDSLYWFGWGCVEGKVRV